MKIIMNKFSNETLKIFSAVLLKVLTQLINQSAYLLSMPANIFESCIYCLK